MEIKACSLPPFLYFLAIRDIKKSRLKTALPLQLQAHRRSPQRGDRQGHEAHRGSSKMQTASLSVPLGSQGDWSGITQRHFKENFNNIKLS